jgi:hypothetical protein
MLRSFLRRPPLQLEEVASKFRGWMETRDARFLYVLKHGVYDHPGSPYLGLLRNARCEFGDIEAKVAADGVEAALRELHAAGVYVAFDEFKSRTPIVRGDHVIETPPGAFDNPMIDEAWRGTSGGTTGRALSIPFDFGWIDDQTSKEILALSSYGLLDAPLVIWRFSLPGDGYLIALKALRRGAVPRAWFSPTLRLRGRSRFRSVWASRALMVATRLNRVSVPYPTEVPLEDPSRVARELGAIVAKDARCVVRAAVGVSARTSLAAVEAGIDLTGVVFMGASEPPTRAKIDLIESSGASYMPVYITTEWGIVGLGCTNGLDQTDVHFMADGIAAIQVPVELAGTGETVDVFCYTNLHDSSPLISLNVESDDFGLLEERACGCPLESYGLRQHIRKVYSHRKLTAEGVTLVGTDVERILEHVLPGRFGGTPFDYQLVEMQDESAATRIDLLVSPDVGDVDPEAVRLEFGRALARVGPAEATAAGIWAEAGTLRVVRERPAWTASGKFLPIRTGGTMRQTTETGGT